MSRKTNSHAPVRFFNDLETPTFSIFQALTIAIEPRSIPMRPSIDAEIMHNTKVAFSDLPETPVKTVFLVWPSLVHGQQPIPLSKNARELGSMRPCLDLPSVLQIP
jgi:hypothetical protein